VDWITDPFQLAFQQRALLGGALAAIATSTVGIWVVIRGMMFLGDALAHGVIPGIALALLFGFSPVLGAIAAAIVMIGGINLVHRQTSFSEDTGIGLLFVGMLGLGVILVSRTARYAGSLTAILFGDVLGVDGGDLWLVGTVAAIAVVVSLVFYRQFLTLSFNEEKATTLGMRPDWAHFGLLALVTLAVVASFQTVGTLLVFGLLVGPPATAALLVRKVPAMMVTSVAIGLGSVALGLLISFYANTSGSATMAVIPVVAFFVVLVSRSALARRSHPTA